MDVFLIPNPAFHFLNEEKCPLFRRVTWWRCTDVSQDHAASIIRVDEIKVVVEVSRVVGCYTAPIDKYLVTFCKISVPVFTG
jgi:hypothetical protein